MNDALPKRKDIRLKGYDYRHVGEYFVTIVTQNRQPLFGRVVDYEMLLSASGMMIKNTICQIPTRFQGAEMMQYVVMPNHIHLLIGKHDDHISLAEIVKWLKGYTTRQYADSVKQGHWQPFSRRLWQRNYYEHIVRNQRAHDYIAQYIYENPQRWHMDALNAECTMPEHIMKTVLSFSHDADPLRADMKSAPTQITTRTPTTNHNQTTPYPNTQ